MNRKELDFILQEGEGLKIEFKEDEEKDIGEITGHIDIVQARYGLIYVLDYKPEAKKVDAVAQLFTYALALSVRTNVWLRNFRCAWFDEKAYYEFNPNDIILAHVAVKFNGQIPEKYLRKYVLNEKARSYFTSSKFQEKRKEEEKEPERTKGILIKKDENERIVGVKR